MRSRGYHLLSIRALPKTPVLFKTSVHTHALTYRYHAHNIATMKAVQVLGTATDHRITLNTSSPQPSPIGSRILIKVHAAGITADEVGWPELYNTPSRIPGHEVSGTVHALGPNYSGPLSIGDSVFAALMDADGEGQAEYATASPGEVARKPDSLSHEEAAVLPIPILTAWEAVQRHSQLKPGMSILITGASGAVGMILVQIAATVCGAKVIALASAQHHAKLKALGAHETIDYRTEGWERSLAKVDVAFDAVGGEILDKCWNTVKDSGKVLTICDPPPPWAFEGEPKELKEHPNVGWKYFIFSPAAGDLDHTIKWVADRKVKPLPVKAFPAEQCAEAWKFAGERAKGAKSVLSFV